MIIGYRAWSPGENKDGEFRLYSVVQDFEWTGPVVGSNIKPRTIKNPQYEVHQTSVIDKGLGFFSYKSYDDLFDDFFEDGIGVIAGAVQVFGSVKVHERGYRSQYAQVLAIADSVGCEYPVQRDYYGFGLPCGKEASFALGKLFFCTEHMDGILDKDLPASYEPILFIPAFLEQVAQFYQCEVMPIKDLAKLGEENGYW